MALDRLIVGMNNSDLRPVLTLAFFADFPATGPSITSPRQQYQVGETAHLTCSAPKSKPPTLLAWYINGEPVSKVKRGSSLQMLGRAADCLCNVNVESLKYCNGSWVQAPAGDKANSTKIPNETFTQSTALPSRNALASLTRPSNTQWEM